MGSLFSVNRPCYVTREEVKRAADVNSTADDDWRLDRAIQQASENVDGRLHRQFFFEDKTAYFDWPNFQYSYPWRIWFDQAELADVTVNVPVLTTGGVVIPNSEIFWGNPNYSPPYTYVELNRATTAAFGISSTPQRDTSVTGTFGYSISTNPAGDLAASALSTDSTITVTNGAIPGVGDMIVIDSERMLVTDKASLDSTYAQSDSGVSTASAADNLINPSGGTYYKDEVVTLDSEDMLVLNIVNGKLVVKRAYNGTVLATHSSSEIYVYRTLSVNRGIAGTTAASHSDSVAIVRNAPPALIRSVALAESVIMVRQELGAYSASSGEAGSNKQTGIGVGVDDLWDEAITRYGRKSRHRVI